MKTGHLRRTRRQVTDWIQNLLPQGKRKGIARYLPAAYLEGRGLEIGALADPLRVPARAYVEYVQCTEHPPTQEQLQSRVQELLDQDYSIHYHVWTQYEILELLLALRTRIGFEIESFCKNRHEVICVLRKDASVKISSDATPAARRAA